MRPIDADALVAKLDDWRGDLEDVDKNDAHDVAYYSAMSRSLRFAKDAPTLDCAPVVHGAWGEYEAPYGFPSLNGFPCSVCGMHQVDIRGLYYCPNCGAKMDGGVQDDH